MRENRLGVDDRTILDAVKRFRSALDRVDPEIWRQVTITEFPHGACGHASELLGRYLWETLAIEPDYVLADFYEADGSWRGGHAWLGIGDLIVDITGDQFGWCPVIVTRRSDIHDAGVLNLRQPLTTDMRWWGIYAAPVYAAAKRILAQHTNGG